MPKLITKNAGGELLSSLVEGLGGAEKERIVSRYGSGFNKVLGDGELVSTCFSLFENDLNVSLTARKLYMHRNTLIYRLNKLKRLTGLDVRKFSDAVDFLIIYNAYSSGVNGR